jgi:hypothetical protein
LGVGGVAALEHNTGKYNTAKTKKLCEYVAQFGYLETTVTNENCVCEEDRFVRKSEQKRPLGRHNHRCKDIKMNFKEIGGRA